MSKYEYANKIFHWTSFARKVVDNKFAIQLGPVIYCHGISGSDFFRSKIHGKLQITREEK